MKNRHIVVGIDIRLRRLRRLAVLGTYASYATLVYALWLGSFPGTGAAMLLAIPPLFAVAAGYWILNQVALLYSAGQPDERQLRVRDLAYFRAYQILSASVGCYLLYEMVAVTSPRFSLWHASTSGEFGAVLFSFLFFSVTLPHAFLAWWEDDYIEDEQSANLAGRQGLEPR